MIYAGKLAKNQIDNFQIYPITPVNVHLVGLFQSEYAKRLCMRILLNFKESRQKFLSTLLDINIQ